MSDCIDIYRHVAVASKIAFTFWPCCLDTAPLKAGLPAWAWMWLIALALFFAAKWITVSRFLRTGGQGSRWRIVAFYLLWPGMDVRAFFQERFAAGPPAREWLSAVLKATFGAAALW